MSNPKISIISPVYNVEKYICRCVDSIIAQTFTDWELILVDDGSPDTSGTICNQYASQDSRIRVIHKQNGGVSAARQTGLDAAQGEYVIHADPDDWVEPTMLEELYAKAKAEDADVVICDYFVNSSNSERIVKQEPHSLDAKSISHELFQQLHGSCCNKLVKRTCFSNYNIRFPEGVNYCEDLYTWCLLYQHPEVKTTYLPNAFYHYCTVNSFMTKKVTRKVYETNLAFAKKLDEILPHKEYGYEIRQAYLQAFLNGYTNNILVGKELRHELYKNLRAAFFETTSKRFRVGYIFILLGFPKFARKFIRF